MVEVSRNSGELPKEAASELSAGLGAGPKCQHNEMGVNFRCVSCGKELVLIPQALEGARARENNHTKETNRYPPGTHEHFSWSCGWEDESA